MTSSSISLYQQQAVKLLSRKSVVLGIPIAAGSIILFLQWRKRKSLKPKPKPKPKQPEPEKKQAKVEEKKEAAQTSESNGEATPASVFEKTTTDHTPEASTQNGSAPAPAPVEPAAPPVDSESSYAAVATAPPPHPASAAPVAPQYSPIRPKHSQEDIDDVRAVGTGFAYAKRPRLGRGRSSEKFSSYEPLRKASAEKREQEEKLRIKEEDDKAAAAAVAAFSPPEPAAPAAPSFAEVAAADPEPASAPTEPAVAAVVPEDEDVPPEAPGPAPAPAVEEAAPEVPDVVSVENSEEKPKFKLNGWQVNGWHHDDDMASPTIEEPVRDMRRPSIIATFEITSTSEPASLSPPGSAAFNASRRPSVVTTISAEPAISEDEEEEEEEEEKEEEGENGEEEEAEKEQAAPPASLPSRRESVTVETAIEIAKSPRLSNGMNGTIHEDEEDARHGVSTTISGPIPVNTPFAAEDDEELAPEDPVPEPAGSTALAKAIDASAVQETEGATRTDSPLASKPVVVAAAAGVPAPQSAVVEEIKDIVERAPLAHLPGMGIPNST